MFSVDLRIMGLLKIRCFAVVVCVFYVVSSTGQSQEASSQAHEVAKKLANPNANLGFLAFPIDFISYRGNLPDASSQMGYKLSFQPSLPYSIGDRTNIFFRPLVPVLFQQPVYTGAGFDDRGVALGDIGFDLALGHTWKSKWITIAGLVGSAPSATDASLGAGQWTLGPELFVGKATGWGFLGVLLTQSWGLSSERDGRTNITGGQYFYTINLKNAWQIQSQPTFSYNHNASSGNKFSFPLGTGVAKTIIAGKTPLKFNLQYWYYLESPDAFGPSHQIRFQISPVVPLPW